MKQIILLIFLRIGVVVYKIKHVCINLLLLCLGGLLFSGCVMPVGPSDDFSGMKNDVFSDLIKKNIQTTSGGDKFVPIYVGTDEYAKESFKILQGNKGLEIVSLFQSNNGLCTTKNTKLLQCTVTRSWKKKAQSSFARGVDWLYDFGNYNDPVLQINYSIYLEKTTVKRIEYEFKDLTKKLIRK